MFLDVIWWTSLACVLEVLVLEKSGNSEAALPLQGWKIVILRQLRWAHSNFSRVHVIGPLTWSSCIFFLISVYSMIHCDHMRKKNLPQALTRYTDEWWKSHRPWCWPGEGPSICSACRFPKLSKMLHHIYSFIQ